MKSVSKANNTFGKGKAFDDEVSSRLYLSSANTNKSSKLKDFTWFKQMAHLGILAALDNQIAEIKKMEDYQNPEVQAVLHDIEALKRPDLSLKEQKLLLSIAETVHQTLKNTGNTELTQSNLKKLEGLALQFGNKDPKWIALGVGLVVLASAIAVTAGILLPGFGLALAVLFVGLLGASSARMGVFSLKHNTSTQEISLVSNLDKLVEKTRTSPGPGQR